MTRIRERVFSADLPGQWEPVESEEPGGLVYRETGGSGKFTVVLLSMRPMFAIADKGRVLSDYVSHRLKYERGRTPSLEQSDPVFESRDDSFEASWLGRDISAGRQHRHRAVFRGDLLADFCLESSLSDDDPSSELAEGVLSTARVFAEPGDQSR